MEGGEDGGGADVGAEIGEMDFHSIIIIVVFLLLFFLERMFEM